jgi:hypothetical protein
VLFNAFISSHRSLIDRNQERFAREKPAILALRGLQIQSRSKDAGERLNEWVTWAGGAQGNAKVAGLSGFVKTPTALQDFRQKLGSWGKTWVEHADKSASFSDFDFSWMRELRAFDYWKLDEAPAVKQALSARQGILPAEIPAPDPNSFAGWVELRLMVGIQQRQLPDAIADTSQLARLLISSENLPLAEAGLRTYSKQLQAAEYYRKAVDPRFDISQLPKAETIASAEWVLQKEELFFSIFTDRDTLADLYANDKPDALGCAVANTRGPWLLRSRRVVGDLFGDSLKVVSRVLHQEWKDCSLARLRPFWDSDKSTTSDLAADPFIPPAIPELVAFPYVYPVLDIIAQVSRRDQGTLPAIMEYSSALRRAMGVSWARQNEPGG